MKIRYLAVLFILASTLCFGQNNIENKAGDFNPDSLKPITITGVVISDSSMMNGMYYLDTNKNNSANYILIFGPYWYSPDSSSAKRPNTGDSITITGGLYRLIPGNTPFIVVYSINGNFWRSPFDSYWNDMGYNSMMGGYDHMGMGFAFGYSHDSLQSVNLRGTILVDSTLAYHHYYLDTNDNGTPDYFLNFGPPWYSPSSDIILPNNGDSVSIAGMEMQTGIMNMIIVYKLNGQEWRDSSLFSNNLGGGWIHSGMGQSQQFHNPFDSTDWMQFNPDWNGGGMMGGGNMLQDSLYCQILEILPQNVPGDSAEDIMAAYETGIFSPNGMNNMMQSEHFGGSMNFNSNVNFQFHFNNVQSNGFDIKSNNVQVKYWNSKNKQWIVVGNSIFNSSNNTISISQKQVSNFYIITADKTTGVQKYNNQFPGNFRLFQNYPNPFNPSTTIDFSLKNSSKVKLTIYNLLGQKVRTLINETVGAGYHSIKLDAANLSTGIYFYELITGSGSKVMKMELLK